MGRVKRTLVEALRPWNLFSFRVEYQVSRSLHTPSIVEWQFLSILGLGRAAACLA